MQTMAVPLQLLQLQLLSLKLRYLRGDNFIVADKLGVRYSFTMTFEDMQWLLGVSQVIIVYTVIWHCHNITQISK